MDPFQRRWQAFKQRPFPEGFAGREIGGVDLATVDSGAAGCITAFIDNGSLDSSQMEVLTRSMLNLRRALPELEGDPMLYFEELMALIEGVLRQCRH
jgi:hypothetical protein